MTRAQLALVVALAASAAPRAASAHLVGVEFGDFYAGALHLVMAPESLAALAALAITAAAQPREVARWMLLALPLGLACGVGIAFLARGGETSTLTIGVVIALSLAVPGVLGVAAMKLSVALVAAVAAVIGASLGWVNGLAAVGAPVDWSLYAPGVISAGTVVGTIAIALSVATTTHADWAAMIRRVVASWIAAAGVVFLGVTIAV